ncbi:hypothetical protein GCM10010922_12240 [Microbacterium sorbitolivorans]|uniref:Glycosyl hydrolase n=1 Tax=Microbacterium sorbitolivorans TaxID=1867410 RepID=A0A367XYH4_9MICO|nr:beta-L-arabinofuranosidase domain-containing protein [Microbacterium sorbitolivorans]RCK58676.1 hypothetical protein DTO57_11035 [Microbacterium sorbitolivorans]GGF38464.1 hypothetical protein GCM10010922_12240 [Microbacterium sorbitolivorans]
MISFPSRGSVVVAGADGRAIDTVRDTVLRLDVDRLLAPFRREAGLPHAETYGGWEATGLDGHTAGHVLSSLSTLSAGGDPRTTAMRRALIAGLAECQAALGSGYIGGVPGGVALWDELRAGRIDAGAFALNDRWVPLYNLHKVLAGLIDAAEIGDGAARDVLLAYAAWWREQLDALDDDALQRVLECEFGGLTESFARLAILTGDAHFLALARRLVPRVLADPLAASRDELDGLHANTRIPVVVGFATIERAARLVAPELVPAVEAYEGSAARVFFERVARHRSVAIGGNSVREHFDSSLASMFIAREGPETCNTHNMIKLAAELHALTGDDRYLQFAERGRRNHLRSAQHPEHGGLAYFTPQRPAHYRVYSAEAEGFWCCMGSGFEAQALHGALAFAREGSVVSVNAPVPATWDADGVRVAQTVAEVGLALSVTITVSSDYPVTLSILVPDWVCGFATGAETGATAEPGARLRVEVEGGSATVTIAYPRSLRFEHASDGSAWGFVVDGPDVLAQRIPDDTVAYRGSEARMSHIAVGPLRPLAETPVLDLVHAERTGPGRVRVPSSRGPIELEPFNGIHDARCTLAWPLGDLEELARIDAASLGLEARTRDVVTFGEQQPESDHGLVADDEQIGREGDVRWRRTSSRIRVTLNDWSGTADTLRLAWCGDDAATLRVSVGGRVLLSAASVSGSSLDIALGADPGTVTHEIEISGSPTPRLTEARLLAGDSDR